MYARDPTPRISVTEGRNLALTPQDVSDGFAHLRINVARICQEAGCQVLVDGPFLITKPSRGMPGQQEEACGDFSPQITMTRSWSCESSRKQRPIVPILSVRASEFEGHDVLDMLIPSAKYSNKTVWVAACLASVMTQKSHRCCKRWEYVGIIKDHLQRSDKVWHSGQASFQRVGRRSLSRSCEGCCT